MNDKLDIDFKTVSRYIASSYLPSQWQICSKILANYERAYPLDVFWYSGFEIEIGR